jgi:hypothetical protein
LITFNEAEFTASRIYSVIRELGPDGSNIFMMNVVGGYANYTSIIDYDNYGSLSKDSVGTGTFRFGDGEAEMRALVNGKSWGFFIAD